MAKLRLPRAEYINEDKALRELVEQLAQEPLIGVDTESNSMYAYHERVCLIQISSRTADYIIDPFPIKDLSPLGQLMSAPETEKIFHAAEYDIMILKRDYNYEFRNIFDTMVASRIIGYDSFGLGSMLETLLNVPVDKSHQRDNWGLRPLGRESLRYAQMDTHYLPRLRDILYQELVDGDFLDEAKENFRELEDIPAATHRTFDPEGYWKIGKPRTLKADAMKILRELYIMRDEIAHERNKPEFKILHNSALIKLAQQQPDTIHELKKIRGIGASTVRRYGKKLLKAIARGQQATDLPKPPRHAPPPQDVSERYIALHNWRKTRATKRGVESDVIISKQVLWDIAYQVPQTLDDLRDIQSLGPWRYTTYGQELLDVLANTPIIEQ